MVFLIRGGSECETRTMPLHAARDVSERGSPELRRLERIRHAKGHLRREAGRTGAEVTGAF